MSEYNNEYDDTQENTETEELEEPMQEEVEEEPTETVIEKATKANVTLQRVSNLASSMVRSTLITFKILLNPITIGIIVALFLLASALALSKTAGMSDFNIQCGPNGTSSVNISADADDFTRQSAIAAWLTSTQFDKLGGPFSKEQAAGVIGNLIQESAGGRPNYIETLSLGNPDAYKDFSNEDILAWGNVSFKAIGILQWDGGRRTGLVNFAISEGKPWHDLNVQLKFLKTELDGSEGDNLVKGGFTEKTHTPGEYAWLWNKLFERSADTEDSPMAAKRRNGAEDFYSKYGGAGSFVNNCTGGSVDTSNVVQLALQVSFPWEDYESSWGSCSTYANCGQAWSKPEYIEAKKIAEELTTPDPMPGVLASCDRFVATILRATGADPTYPWGAVANQLDYMQSSPKWEMVSCQDRLPGDVLITSGHIMLYVGVVDGRESLASASYMERTAAVGPTGCNGNLWNADSYTDVQGWRLTGQ